MKTARRLRQFVEDELLEQPAGSDPLAAGLLDSLAIEQLIAFIEERFDIVFDDEDLVEERFASLDAVAELVDLKRKQAP
jgi:acyl carrier protein